MNSFPVSTDKLNVPKKSPEAYGVLRLCWIHIRTFLKQRTPTINCKLHEF